MPTATRAIQISIIFGFLGVLGCTSSGGEIRTLSCVVDGDTKEPEVKLLRDGCQYIDGVIQDYNLSKSSKTISGDFESAGKTYTISCIIINGRVHGEVLVYGRNDHSMHSTNFIKGKVNGVLLAEYPSGFRVLGSFTRGAQSGTWMRIAGDGRVVE